MKVAYVADSSANRHTNRDMKVGYAPMKIVTDQKEYVDTPDLDVRGMLEELKAYKGRSGTACPSVSDWIDAFDDADMVLAVAITSGLSGTYNSACIAAEQYKETRPDAKVFVFDSLSTGGEMQLILEKYQECVEQGMEFEEICDTVREYHKQTHLLFSLESLDNLVKNGRVNPIVGKLAGVLGLRMVGRASTEGTLEPIYKSRGEKKAIQNIVKEMKQVGYKGGKARITHTFNPNMAETLTQQLRSEWPNADIDIAEHTALCGYYAELGGLIIGYEA